MENSRERDIEKGDEASYQIKAMPRNASSDNIRGRAASYSIFARNSGEDASSKGGDTASWNSAAMPGRLSTDTSTSISLDPEKPSPFVVYHHSHNLIQKIIRQKDSSIARLFKFGTYHPTKSELNGQAHSDDNNRWKRDKDYSFRISFAELQRMHLRKLQCKLVKHVVDMRYHSSEPDTWEADLQQYVQAMQDYDYMMQCSQLLRDPFLVTGERYIDDYVIKTTLGDTPLGDLDEIQVIGPWEDDNAPIGGTRHENMTKSWSKGFRERIIMAAVGGIFLLGPMWLMVMHNTRYTALVSTTVLVTVFGLLMAWFLDKRMDVLSSTAAYAAVLVVLVGLSTTSSG